MTISTGDAAAETEARSRTFVGDGEMAARARAFDWARTPLGPVGEWPECLRTSVATMLASGFASVVLWGRELIQLYNDAYVPFLGDKHPAALGRPTHEIWPEIRRITAPVLERVFRGESVTLTDQLFALLRHGPDAPPDDYYITLTYVPVRDERGVVAGVFVAAHDSTAAVRGRSLEAERDRLLDALTAEREALRSLIVHMPSPVALLTGPELRHTLVNDEFRRISAGRDVTGLTVREAFPELAGQGIVERLERVYATGETWAASESLVRYDRDGTGVRDTWFDVRFVAVRDATGAVTGILNFAIDVTEQVMARREVEATNAELRATVAALGASEARFRGVLEVSPDGFQLCDSVRDAAGRVTDFLYTEVNAAGLRLVGRTADEMLGRRMLEVFPGLAGTPLFGAYVRVAETGEPFERDVAYARDGLEGGFRVTVVRVGEGIALAFADATERLLAEAERVRLLAETEAAERRLRTVFEQAPALIAVTEGPEHRFVLANRGFEEIVGRGRLAGRSLREALPELETQGIFTLLDRVYATGEPYVATEQRVVLARDGGAYAGWYNFVYQPLTNAAGAVYGILQHVVEVTEQVRSRQAVELARERSDAVLASIADAFYLLDRDWRFTYVNAAAEPLLQTTRDALLGRTLWEAFPDVVGSPFETPYREAMATGRATSAEAYFAPLGTWFDVRSYAWAGGLMVHFRDIGDRKAAEAERERLLAAAEQARAEAEAANRAKSEFLAVMSHELRTPLNAIGGYAELIEMGIHGPVTPDQLTALARVQKSQRHLLGLINGVLNYARVEAGAVHYEIEDVPLDEVLATCEALTAPQVRARGLTLRRDAVDPAIRVRADRDKVQQIVLNLLSNAVKFTEPGGALELRCSTDGATVLVRVSDTGRGIAASQLARVFEPFVQVDARLTRTQEGTGLGLAISRDLARGMGGELTVESTPGVGSVFTLELPRG